HVEYSDEPSPSHTGNQYSEYEMTSVAPVRPATTLVIGGPYRFTRNPMYVGLAALTVALCLFMQSAWLSCYWFLSCSPFAFSSSHPKSAISNDVSAPTMWPTSNASSAGCSERARHIASPSATV